MNAPVTLSKVEQLRARDGDACWLCTRQLNFSAVPNSKNAPTIEHLVAKSLGGGGELKNLVLTHPHCNRQLADKPLARKQEMRAKAHANAAKIKAAQSGSTAKVSAAEPPVKAATPVPPDEAHSPITGACVPSTTYAELHAEIAYWRRLALISGGGLLLSLGFVLGGGAVLLLS